MKQNLTITLLIISLVLTMTGCNKNTSKPSSNIKTIYECSHDSEKSTTIINKNNDNYSIEYTSDTYGTVGGEIDKSTYDRIIKIIDYIKENEDEFNEKAKKYSELNYADPDADLLLDFMFSLLALGVDDSQKDSRDHFEREFKYHIDDIEQIINHEEVQNEYTIYTNIRSSINDNDGYITHYYNEEDKNIRIVDFDTYKNTWNYYTNEEALPYTDEDKDYIVLADIGFSCWVDLRLEAIEIKYNKVNLVLYSDHNGVMADGGGALLIIPVEKGTKIGNIEFKGPSYKQDPNFIPAADKPVIYLYGYDGDVNVMLDADFTCTYPKYEKNGWNVTAEPDGMLTDKNGKRYRYLFWEGQDDYNYDMSDGFCVKGEDTAEFLEGKLRILGLNNVEINEFIIYWLPQMEHNNYNVIKFQTTDYENNHPMQVTPKPDSELRVFMTWYPSDTYIDVKKQELKPFVRKGKTVVEWGGSAILKN